MKKAELMAATAFALFAAAPALAQEATAPNDTTAQDYDNANDIVVTATRRNETVQDVPIAITAVGAELLENAGVQDIRGLEQLAPSLQTTTGQSAATGASLFIRGIGTAGDNPGFEPAVGVFIDGVFRPRAGVALSELPELERIEILRGPQGTLFGRNTSAGALSIFTAQPRFDKLSGHIEASYGNYNAWEIAGAITGPVSEAIALRFDGGYRKRDGYIRDANSDRSINNIDRYNLRGQALIDTGDVTFRLIADYSKTDEACCGAVSVAQGPLTPVLQSIAASQGRVGLYTGPASDRIQAMSPNRSFGEQVKDYGVSSEINWDLGEVKLTSISAVRNWRATRNQDIDFSGVDRAYRDDYATRLRDITQEVRLQGSAFDGKLDWLIGGFYLNEELTLRDSVKIGTEGNRYVDTVFAGQLRGAFGTPLQFFGSLGPSVPTLGGALLNPAVPNSLPALSAAYGALAPLVGCFRAQAGTAPAGTCVIPGYPSAPIPGLAALAAGPLPGATAGQGNNPDFFRVKTNAIALFTHNIVRITDQLSLTVGARYNHETKKLNAAINNNLGSCTFFNQVRAGNAAATAYANVLRQVPGLFNNLFLLSCNPAVNTEFNGNYAHDRSENEITGTAKLAFKASDKLLVYGSYDRGYKSGGYNLDQATFDSVLLGGNGPQASDLEFGSETVDSFEIGLKYSPARSFTFNLAGFYAKYHDLQNLVFSGNNFVVQNIDSTTSRGIEAESVIRPASDFTVRLAYTYLDAKYDASNNFTGTPLAGLEGQQIQNQPKHTVTSTVTWEPQLSSGVRGLAHIDMRYNSAVEIAGVSTIPGRGIVRNPGYPLLNARLGLQNNAGTVRGEFFVENLTNQYYNITGFAVPEQTGNYAGYPGYPRFYGARVRFGF